MGRAKGKVPALDAAGYAALRDGYRRTPRSGAIRVLQGRRQLSAAGEDQTRSQCLDAAGDRRPATLTPGVVTQEVADICRLVTAGGHLSRLLASLNIKFGAENGGRRCRKPQTVRQRSLWQLTIVQRRR